NRQIAQPGMNMGQDRQMQMVGGNCGNQFRQYAGQNAGNPAGYNKVQNVRNQVALNPRVQNSRSSAISIPSTLHTAGALSPTRADLLPPHKRYRGTLAMHLYESTDESSPETHTKSYMDLDIQADIEAKTAAATTITATTMVESESKPEEAEADEEANVEIEQEGRNLIAKGERFGLLGHVMALECSNTRLQDALGVERVRANSLQIMTITCSSMTPEAIEELISRRVEEALAAQEANRNTRLIDENQSQIEMITITEVKEMETIGTILGMEIRMKEMEVQEEMHPLLGFVPTRIFSTVNHATLGVLKETLVWLGGSRKWNQCFISVIAHQPLK
nr:hypothetical protein [Tanacetum cinerariifolium]